jgi:hypothetical protein
MGYVDGPNLHGFCAGDPINSRDPFGLDTDSDGVEWNEGFFESITSGHTEPSFGKSLIPIVGSTQSANYHFNHGNPVRGVLYTALAITDVFLVRSIVTSALRFSARGLALNEILNRNVLRLGTATSVQGRVHSVVFPLTFSKETAKEILGHIHPGMGEGGKVKYSLRLLRTIFQEKAKHDPRASVVNRLLSETFKIRLPGGKLTPFFEAHHWGLQNSWIKAAGRSLAPKYPTIAKLVKGFGNSGVNLIPLPRLLNAEIGQGIQGAIATASVAGHNIDFWQRLQQLAWPKGEVISQLWKNGGCSQGHGK